MRFTLFALAVLVFVACAGARAETLFESGAKWSYYKGNEHPSGGDLEWTEPDFDDSDWPSGDTPSHNACTPSALRHLAAARR